MEKKLKKLFDYQRFAGNPHLARIISETEDRYGKELSDDSLAQVSAAGEVTAGGDDGKSGVGGLSGNPTDTTVFGSNIGGLSGK